jgi:hypothetical protein
MPSLTITTRQTRSGRRYVVRYRLGGRVYPVEHGGSFKTLREAKARRDLIGGELAAGRNPADALRALVEQPTRRNFRSWASAYETSRIDFAAETAKNPCSGVDHVHEHAGVGAVDDQRPPLRRRFESETNPAVA